MRADGDRVELCGGARNGARGRSSNCISTRPSRRFMCASAPGAEATASPMRRDGPGNWLRGRETNDSAWPRNCDRRRAIEDVSARQIATRAGGIAPPRSAAVCRRRTARREDRWPSGCRQASTCRRCCAAAAGICAARRQSRARRRQMDVPHRQRSRLAADARDDRARKLSRAAIETLAIVAYHQPVTRAEIEEIRGVTTSKGTLDVLLETGWIACAAAARCRAGR